MGPRFRETVTPGGYRLDEVVSALQKTIRRGLEREAVWWVTELDLAGYGAWAFRRLRVICSEDVGLAWPEGPAVIRSLYESWLEARKAEKNRSGVGDSALYLVHAALLLARAPKSRIVDNAVTVMYAGDRAAMRIEMPDYAVDHHTAEGRRRGRREATVYEESYRIEGQAVDDPYLDEARSIDVARKPRRSTWPRVDERRENEPEKLF